MPTIHELIATTEPCERGGAVSEVVYLGFFEVTQGGVVCVKDTLTIGGVPIGTIVGFDLTHMPNHLNLVIGVSEAKTGMERSLALGADLSIAAPGRTLTHLAEG